MAEAVYVLCALLSIGSAILLIRGYRISKSSLLMWSSLCFSLMALNNIILFVDMMIVPEIDISGPYLRNLTGALAGTLLLFGLIWEIS